MAEAEEVPLTKDAVLRECIRVGTALPRAAVSLRYRLATLHHLAEAIDPADTAALVSLATDVAKVAQAAATELRRAQMASAQAAKKEVPKELGMPRP